MVRITSPPRHGPEQGLWFFILIAVLFAAAFVALFLFVPR